MNKNTTDLLKKWVKGEILSDQELRKLYKELKEIQKVLSGKGSMFDMVLCEVNNHLISVEYAVHARRLW